MIVYPGETSGRENPIIQFLSIGSILTFGIIFWIFTTKKHEKALTEIEKSEISGVVTNKEIKEKQFLLTIKTYSPIVQDTSADFGPWEKLFEACQLNDTLIKKAGTYDIVIKRNGQIRIFTLAPEYR